MADRGLGGPKRYVPLWDDVHVPDWAEPLLDSETGPIDRPLANGITGEIGLEITAITPIFVGARQEDVRENNQEAGKRKHWLLLGGRPSIPGSSVKGAIRAVIEIATRGRFADRIDERRLSIRDLQNPTDYVRHLTDMFRPLSRAGWLTPSRRGWTLEPCNWSLVRQEDLEAYVRKRFNRRVDLGHRQTAVEKYSEWGGDLDIAVDIGAVTTEGSFANGRELSRATQVGTGSDTGRLVFTGQPQNRSSRNAKATEFVFHGAGAAMDVPKAVRRDFEDIHREVDGTPNAEWGYWLGQAKQGARVPVFWLEDDAGGIRAMGLAMMFRLPYALSLREAAKQKPDRVLKAGCWDMADLIFGRVLDTSEEGQEGLDLRGRAAFGHFREAEGRALMAEEETVLLAPKYGFYPANVRQREIAPGKPLQVVKRPPEGRGNPKPVYTTLQDPEARLRGPARYVASRGHALPRPQADAKGKLNRKIVTRIRPMPGGTCFRGTLRVFNLDPRELGALIWALHWGGAPDDPLSPHPGRAHMLGAGRPAGLGACRIAIDSDRTVLATNDADYTLHEGEAAKTLVWTALERFTAYMEARVPGWSRSRQIVELLASVDLDQGDRLRADGQLDPLRSPRAFVEAKQAGFVLPLASGGYEVSPSPVAAPTRAGGRSAPGGAARGTGARLLWRAGDVAVFVEEAEEVSVVENVRPDATTAMVRFADGDTETVPVTALAKP